MTRTSSESPPSCEALDLPDFGQAEFLYQPSSFIKIETLAETEGVTFTHGVPTILQMLLAAATASNTDLTGLKMVIGGSELSKGLARQALALGVDVYAGYGMSESAPLLCSAQGTA